MNLPTWVIGENLEEREPIESYLVHLHTPFLVAKVTQKRGWKIMLTIGGSIVPQDEAWYRLLHEGARHWAEQVEQHAHQQFTQFAHPPEIQVKEKADVPRFLLCDNAGLDRTFIVHTGGEVRSPKSEVRSQAAPPFVAEIRSAIPHLPPEHPRLCNAKGQWLVVQGDFPASAGIVLHEIARLLGW